MAHIFSAILTLIAFSLAIFAAFSFTRRKKSPVALSLAWLLAALAIYAGAYAGEIISTSLGRMLIWNTIEYLGISFIPALWILFTAQYYNARWIQYKRLVGILLSISALTLIAVLTDPVFHLRYTSAWVRTDGLFPVLGFTRGPFYWSHSAFTLLSFTVGTILLTRIMFTSSRFFARQQLFMLAGTCLPWINYWFYLAGFTPWGIDTIPFSLFLSAVCFGISIFGFKLLTVIPMARGVIFETMSDGVIVLDVHGRIVDFNKAGAALFPELTPSSFSGNIQQVLSRYEPLCKEVSSEEESEFLLISGETDSRRYYQCRISFIFGRGKTQIGKIILLKDNTDSTLLLEKLRELATIDPLTRLFNRRHFIEQAAKQITQHARTTRPLSLLIIDLDHFKQINDAFGHLMGDEVLRTLAGILASELRGVDIAARFGGEEFICLLPETDSQEAYTTAERMRQAIRKTCISFPGAPDISISASFGVCCKQKIEENEKIDTLIGRADVALYRAKETGRNKSILYIPGMESPGPETMPRDNGISQGLSQGISQGIVP